MSSFGSLFCEQHLAWFDRMRVGLLTFVRRRIDLGSAQFLRSDRASKVDVSRHDWFQQNLEKRRTKYDESAIGSCLNLQSIPLVEEVTVDPEEIILTGKKGSPCAFFREGL